MNVKRLKLLADTVRSERVAKFDMSTLITVDDCGTVACLAGTARILMEGGMIPSKAYGVTIAADWLEIDTEQAEKLFFGNRQLDYLHIKPTPDQAADVILKLIETGEVFWPDC